MGDFKRKHIRRKRHNFPFREKLGIIESVKAPDHDYFAFFVCRDPLAKLVSTYKWATSVFVCLGKMERNYYYWFRIREGSHYQIGWIFGKVSRGGVIFNPKIYIADFGNFKQGFLSMELIKRRVILGFRVCFFQQLDWYKLILTDTFWPMPPCINVSISIIKNLHYNFPKMRGGGQRPFGIFPKVHPIW